MRSYQVHNSLLPIYLAWQLNPNSSNFNLSFSYRLNNAKELNLLIMKFQELIKIKPHLRQTFDYKDNKLTATIHDELPAEINYFNFSEKVFAKLEPVFIKQPHEINSKSPVRLDVVNFHDSTGCIVIFNIHHIVMDGYSLDSLIHDLNKLLANEGIEPLDEETYISEAASIQALEDPASPETLKYLEEIKRICEEIDYPQASDKNTLLHYEDILSENLLLKLKKFSDQNDISLFNIFLLTWGIFVSKLFNHNHSLVTYPVNIRDHQSIDGCFINMLPFAVSYKNNDNFLTLVESWRTKLSFLKSLSKIKLYDKFSIDSIPSIAYSNITRMLDLKINDRNIEAKNYPNIANSNLGLKYRENNGGYYFSCDVIAEIFPEYLASTLIPRYFNYLHKLLDAPKNALLAIDLTFEEERQKLLLDFNNTDAPFPTEKTLVDLFDESAKAFPDNIAVKACNGELTYRELKYKAESLAAHLIESGVKTEDIVGILIDNRLEMIVGVLAILKAGAAYLPIPHDMPTNRVNYILNDCRAKLLLTLPALLENFHNDNIKIINLAQNVDLKPYEQPNIKPTNLAYVIYTSGTTGWPKGVLLEHSTIINLIAFYIKQFKLNSKTNCSKYAGFGFDASVIEIFPALAAGASLHIIPNEMRKDLGEVCQFFNVNKINFGFLPTQLAELFLKTGNNYSLNYLIVAGEKLHTYKPVNYSIVNSYGPTEASVHVTYFNVDQQYKNIPIGKPIDNVKCYIVDNNLNLSPIGMSGELMIGGECLSRGYLNQPQLTQEKFISNPFQTPQEKKLLKNTRLYKTGDVARWLPDGNLEFIGRNDYQIKIRGYRIEPGEIESCLQKIDHIEQVLVTTIENKKKDKFLCAYYTSKSPINPDEIKVKLSAYLVEYMIPDYFFWLEKFPINSNGKIDRKLLPGTNFCPSSENYMEPTSPKETLVCEAFGKILGISKVSVNDDFFKLGGNSIKAITLVSDLQANFIINVADVFNLKTPRQIAHKITFVKNYLGLRFEKIKQAYHKSPPIQACGLDQKDQVNKYLSSLNEVVSYYPRKPLSNILLTGGTGYFGANLINQLLLGTDYKIYLLVRANSQKEAFNKLNNTYQFYFGASLEKHRGLRIFVFAADIEKSNLGLSLKNYQMLLSMIDTTIHSAALTKHYGEYEKFYSANVQATINLLEFTKLTKTKDFHYISTTSVLDHGYIPNHDQYIFTENDTADCVEGQSNVYVKTKYEGEKEVIKYRKYGINSNIYRIGNLAFISTNYKVPINSNDNGFITRLRCILKLGMIAQEISVEELTPVDLAAKATVMLFDKSSLSNQTYHIFNPNLYNIASTSTSENLIKLVSIDQFIDKIVYCLTKPSYQKLIDRYLLHRGWLEEEIIAPTKITILQDKTSAILSKMGFQWPIITDKIFNEFIKKLLFSLHNCHEHEKLT